MALTRPVGSVPISMPRSRARGRAGIGGDRTNRGPTGPLRSGGVVRLTMPVVYTDDHRAHRVATGVWCGVTIDNDELPARADLLRDACVAAGATVHPATEHGLGPLLAVHD